MGVEEKTCNAVLRFIQKNVQQNKFKINCINNYIFIGQRVWYIQSVCARRICWYSQCGGSVFGGLGYLTVSLKN